MLFHQLGQYLVLLLQLRLQEGDALFAGLDLFVSVRRRPEGRGPVLKKLLEPPVENRGVERCSSHKVQTGTRSIKCWRRMATFSSGV
jgi:hypothetical protein